MKNDDVATLSSYNWKKNDENENIGKYSDLCHSVI